MFSIMCAVNQLAKLLRELHCLDQNNVGEAAFTSARQQEVGRAMACQMFGKISRKLSLLLLYLDTYIYNRNIHNIFL